MNFLDDKERAGLRIQHKQEWDGRIRDRIKAVLLYDKGWSFQQIVVYGTNLDRLALLYQLFEFTWVYIY